MAFLTILAFTLSAGLAAGAILTGVRIRSQFRIEVFTTLLYYLMFVFTFGFYAMWGQSIVKIMVSEFLSENQMERIVHAFILMGLPFLVISWLMLIRFALEITMREKSRYLTIIFLSFNLALIITLGIALSSKPPVDALTLLKYFYLGPGMAYTLYVVFILTTQKEKRNLISAADRNILAVSLLLFSLTEAILLYFYQGGEIIGLLFLFIFFTGKAFPAAWLQYGADLTRIKAPVKGKISISEFCKRFEVSPREADIIREICNGLSNGEIAEKLFISLQTVKDHTHRIYIKTNVRNRMQLMTLAREYGL